MESQRICFRDRGEAGRRLAERVGQLSGDVLVAALPRGGVPVALPVAESLGAPLDVLLVRKLGVPGQRELAMGAIGEGGAIVVNDAVVQRAGVSRTAWRRAVRHAKAELGAQRKRFGGLGARAELANQSVIIVDDGIATGSTVRAACQIARQKGANEVIIATPVAPPDMVEALEKVADSVVVVATPYPFWSIGRFYDDFRQVTDDEVVRLFSDNRRGFVDGDR